MHNQASGYSKNVNDESKNVGNAWYTKKCKNKKYKNDERPQCYK